MSLFFRTFQHLLPDALAWRIRQGTAGWTIGDGSLIGDLGLLIGGVAGGRDIDRFFAGLANFFAEARDFVDLVRLDMFAETTRDLAEWEYQFGLQRATLEADRRANVDAAHKAKGGQSPRYIQDVIQAAGFDVYVHEWWVPPAGSPWTARDPRDYTNVPTTGTVQCGEPLALCGEPDALCDNFLANEPDYLVNSNLTPYAPPLIPSDPARWRYVLYFGAAVFPNRASVPAARRGELRALMLKLRPTHNWVVTLIDYV